MKLDLQRLKAERIAKGYTQEDTAKMLGWSDRARYGKRESGFINMGADEFIQIASILGYDTDNLAIFFREDVPEKEQKEVK